MQGSISVVKDAFKTSLLLSKGLIPIVKDSHELCDFIRQACSNIVSGFLI